MFSSIAFLPGNKTTRKLLNRRGAGTQGNAKCFRTAAI